jgi:glycosyltransferase involved in cell wall biosynthesis
MTEKPYISVVVPVFNEEGNVEPLYARTKEVLSREAGRYEILFVDDGSTDATAARVTALHRTDPLVKLISLSRNFGHQVALRAGIDHASGDLVVTMDGDLQHPPEVIPQLLAKQREGFDVVSGVKSGHGKRSFFLELTAGLYYLLCRLFKIPVDPHASDFRVMEKKVVDALRATRESTRFLRGLVKWVGFRSATVPYERGERLKGRPSYTLRRRFEVAFAGLFSFTTAPLRLATLTGLCLAAVAVALAIYLAILVGAHGFGTMDVLLLVVLFLSGIHLFFLGIVGEYLGRVFMEVKRRPLYLVREKLGLSADTGPRP